MADLFIGLMSGTSADGIDAALVRFAPLPHVVSARTFNVPPPLRQRIRGVTLDTPLGQLATLDVELGELFAQSVNLLLQEAGVQPDQVRAIGSHGQTVWHQPQGTPAFTLQIGDPNIISERTTLSVVADFRRRDLAAGGEGAPLVPAFHAEVFGSASESRCVVNLGGIANITMLPRDPDGEVFGFDTGPANTLVDAWTVRHLGQRCDIGGAWAAGGHCSEALLSVLLQDPYFQQPAPKSTGREHFSLDWLDRQLAQTPRLDPQDVQATLVELTARTVAAAIRASAADTERVLVCGGGVHNPILMRSLAAHMAPAVVESTAAQGVDPDYVEACAFAWLARQTLEGKPGNLTPVTGARRAAVLGAIYPGLRGL